jgi:hypothetical protein
VSREKRKPGAPQKPCCMVSEILEEAGIDRERARQIRRQVLEGVILLCRWQLERMEGRREAAPSRGRARKVEVE